MTTLEDWFARTAWGLRAPGFGELRERQADRGARVVTIDYAPAGGADGEAARFWELWRGLPRHPNLLEVLAPRTLRYAALDWPRLAPRRDVRSIAVADVATWGIELARVYELVAARVPAADRGWLAATPQLNVDLEGALRVAFVPPPVGATCEHGRCDEPALVAVVGRGLGALAPDAANQLGPLRPLIARCVAEDRAHRFATLHALIEALVSIGGHRRPPLGLRDGRLVWRQVEAGLGLLALGLADRALAPFKAALAEEHRTGGERTTVLAACIAAIERGPTAQGMPAPMIPVAPLDARVSSTGPDARELMRARRELARSIAAFRVSAGTSRERASEIPAHLGELRVALSRGESKVAVALLRAPDHLGDPVAQLLLASLLAFEGDHASALAAYAHAHLLGAEHRPRALLGQADVLLAMGDASAALALYHTLRQDHADLPGVQDGRIHALRQLGRVEEAEGLQAGEIAAAAASSDARVATIPLSARP